MCDRSREIAREVGREEEWSILVRAEVFVAPQLVAPFYPLCGTLLASCLYENILRNLPIHAPSKHPTVTETHILH